MRQAQKKIKRNDQVAQPLRRHGMSKVSENNNLMVWLETVVEELFEPEVSTFVNQPQSMVATDSEDNLETPRQKKSRENTYSPSDIPADNVSEPEIPFRSPHILLNASQSRRTTKKTYAEAVSGGSGSEDEVEVKMRSIMRKKALQQESREKHNGVVVTKAHMVRMIFVTVLSLLIVDFRKSLLLESLERPGIKAFPLHPTSMTD